VFSSICDVTSFIAVTDSELQFNGGGNRDLVNNVLEVVRVIINDFRSVQV
jgi:hypothetical protein